MSKKTEPQAPARPTLPPGKAIALLRDMVEKGRELLANPEMSADDAEAWSAEAEEALADALGRDHPLTHKATAAGAPIITMGMGRGQLVARYRVSIPSQLKFMEGTCISYLERQPEELALEVPRQAPDALARLHRVLTRFHAVVLSLRQRYNKREPLSINDEYDVQDLLAALLTVDCEDIRPEEHTPSYAGKSTRMDFLLKSEQVVVEAKYAKHGHADREIGSELIEDIARYRTHPDCKRLVCFVYDPTHAIRNATALERDLSGTRDGLQVEVIVGPKP